MTKSEAGKGAELGGKNFRSEGENRSLNGGLGCVLGTEAWILVCWAGQSPAC